MSEKKKTINAFVLIVLLFGLISLFTSYPLSNGDEGFHMAKSYSVFSETSPKETSEKRLREIELTAISQPKQISIRNFYSEKIDSVANDGIKFNVLTDHIGTYSINRMPANSELMAGVTVKSPKDGDLTNSIKMDTSAVNAAKSGTYTVKYSVIAPTGGLSKITIRTITFQ